MRPRPPCAWAMPSSFSDTSAGFTGAPSSPKYETSAWRMRYRRRRTGVVGSYDAVTADDIVETAAAAPGRRSRRSSCSTASSAFLDEHGLGAGEFCARRIGEGGGSNFTFLLERGPDRFVLRRPPRPPLPPSAHDVVREARLQLALRDAGFDRLPTIVAVCEDDALLGVPFYVMDYLDGLVPTDELPPGLDGESERRRARRGARRRARRNPLRRRRDARADDVRPPRELQRAAGRALRAALGDQQDARPSGRRGGRHGARRPRARGTRADGGARRLPARQHDGRCGRTGPDPRRPRLGDGSDRRSPRRRRLPPRDLQGAGRPAEPARHVARHGASGLSVAHRPRRSLRRAQRPRRRPLAWFEALALWKAAVFCEAIYGRYLRGELGAEDARAARFEEGVPYLAEAAASLSHWLTL